MLEIKNNTPEDVRAMLLDDSLSMKAKGLLSILCLDEMEPNLEELTAASSDGATSLRSAIADAEKSGYLIRERMRDEHGRLTKYRWTVDCRRYN